MEDLIRDKINVDLKIYISVDRANALNKKKNL